MLESLTPEQKKQLSVYANEFTNRGLSTDPANFTLAEQCLIDAYKVAGLQPPQVFEHVSSPLAAMELLKDKYNQDPKVIWGKCGYGNHDVAWLSFYAYFLEVCNLKAAEPLKPLIELTKYAGWYYPFTNVCVICDRPSLIKQDVQFRLHCDAGPALQYRDGFSLYYWHGIKCPEQYIMTPAIDLNPELVLTETNTSLRLMLISKIGFFRLRHILKPKTISTSNDTTLLDFEIDNEKVRALHLKWDTKYGDPLETIIPVPSNKETWKELNSQYVPNNPDDAEDVRWAIMGLDPSEYQLVSES